ncbi:BMC domain-containing protein [bacterium]|nr:BMC domain-containing protein [candidate division CSSED10-310 bacterium]
MGLLEFSSIASGHVAEDAMLKAGTVDLVLARTICSGKYLVIVSGDVDAVRAALYSGKENAQGTVVDELLLPYVHPAVLPALACVTELTPEDRDAMGIVETYSAVSAVRGADAACKAADIILFRLHLAMAVGGKGYFCFTGDIASVQAAIDAAVDLVGGEGLLAGAVTIPRPREELFRELF